MNVRQLDGVVTVAVMRPANKNPSRHGHVFVLVLCAGRLKATGYGIWYVLYHIKRRGAYGTLTKTFTLAYGGIRRYRTVLSVDELFRRSNPEKIVTPSIRTRDSDRIRGCVRRTEKKSTPKVPVPR